MAVEDKYVNTNVAAGKLANPALQSGAQPKGFVVTFEVAVADDNGSVYRLCRLPSSAILTKLDINADAITAGTDYDVGFYKVGVGGAVVDKDELADGLDLSSGAAIGSEAQGLSAVDIANLGKKVYELLGLTVATKEEYYDLAITANTVGSAAGTITVRGEYIQG